MSGTDGWFFTQMSACVNDPPMLMLCVPFSQVRCVLDEQVGRVARLRLGVRRVRAGVRVMPSVVDVPSRGRTALVGQRAGLHAGVISVKNWTGAPL